MRTDPRIIAATALLVCAIWTQSASAFYNPTKGRWLNRDPIGEAGGKSLYAVTYNNLVDVIDPVGLWTRGTWTGGWGTYTGLATAECRDSLSRLAQLITGRASDWIALGISENIAVGQQIDVSPLLIILENRLRANIVSGTAAFNAGFGHSGQDIPTQPTASDTVDQFFANGDPVGLIDCLDAVNLVWAKGLITTLGAANFGLLNYDYSNLRWKWKDGGALNPIGNMRIGDHAFFRNYADIPSNYAENGENVVKVGTDSYWGFYGTSSSHSYNEWLNELRSLWSNVYPGKTQPTNPPPGFTGHIRFLDVSTIAMEFFDLRKD